LVLRPPWSAWSGPRPNFGPNLLVRQEYEPPRRGGFRGVRLRYGGFRHRRRLLPLHYCDPRRGTAASPPRRRAAVGRRPRSAAPWCRGGDARADGRAHPRGCPCSVSRFSPPSWRARPALCWGLVVDGSEQAPDGARDGTAGRGVGGFRGGAAGGRRWCEGAAGRSGSWSVRGRRE